MPVFIHLANLIFQKETIEKKYHGGCNQFRIDWKIGIREVNQEDDELFSLATMNIDEFDIGKLIERGLDFNQETQHSDDFVAILRYGGKQWKADWLESNDAFAWSPNCKQDQKDRVHHIYEDMDMEDIKEAYKQGIDVFKTIKSAEK